MRFSNSARLGVDDGDEAAFRARHIDARAVRSDRNARRLAPERQAPGDRHAGQIDDSEIAAALIGHEGLVGLGGREGQDENDHRNGDAQAW